MEERGLIDKPISDLKPCNKCGRDKDHYTIGYSEKPYFIGCQCGRLVGDFNNLEDLKEAWNNDTYFTPKQVLETEELLKEKIKEAERVFESTTKEIRKRLVDEYVKDIKKQLDSMIEDHKRDISP